MLLVQMERVGGQVGGAVRVNILVIIIGLIFIINSSRGTSGIMGRESEREIIGSSGKEYIFDCRRGRRSIYSAIFLDCFIQALHTNDVT